MFRFLSPAHAALLPACDQPQPRIRPPSFTSYNGKPTLYNNGSTRSYDTDSEQFTTLRGEVENCLLNHHFVKIVEVGFLDYTIALTDTGQLYFQSFGEPFTLLYLSEQVVDMVETGAVLTVNGKIYITERHQDSLRLLPLELPAFVTKMYCEEDELHFITTGGEVYSWSDNLYSGGVRKLPIPLRKGERVIAFAADSGCSVFLTDRGRVYARILSVGFFLYCKDYILSVTLCDGVYLFATTVSGKFYSARIVSPEEDDDNGWAGIGEFTYLKTTACFVKVLSAAEGTCTVLSSGGRIYEIDVRNDVVTRLRTPSIIRGVTSYQPTVLLTDEGKLYIRSVNCNFKLWRTPFKVTDVVLSDDTLLFVDSDRKVHRSILS